MLTKALKRLRSSENSGSHGLEEDDSSGMLRHSVTQKLTDVSKVLTNAIITQMMALSTIKTSVSSYETTQRNIRLSSLALNHLPQEQ
jgi:hypothetical protein